jgi:hypothetical protein
MDAYVTRMSEDPISAHENTQRDDNTGNPPTPTSKLINTR